PLCPPPPPPPFPYTTLFRSLQLRGGQLLKRVVMQIAGQSTAFLLHHRRHVLEQELARAVDLGQPVHRPPQLLLRVPQLGHETRRQACRLEDPGVLTRKSACLS